MNHKTNSPHTKKHFIGLAGQRGCLPNYCDVFVNKTSAAQALAELHECGQDFAKCLSRDGTAALRPEDGNEYCEIQECSCSEPWIHQDGLSKAQWLRERGEDFGFQSGR